MHTYTAVCMFVCKRDSVRACTRATACTRVCIYTRTCIYHAGVLTSRVYQFAAAHYRALYVYTYIQRTRTYISIYIKKHTHTRIHAEPQTAESLVCVPDANDA